MNLFRKLTVSCAAVVLCSSIAVAQQIDYYPMPPGIHPVVDGQVTTPLPASPGALLPEEWIHSNYTLNAQSCGTFRAEWQRNWTAVSSTSQIATYSGTTLFNMHDLWSFAIQEIADYNVFEYSIGTSKIKCWVFANGNEPDDSTWIGNSELGPTYAGGVDDRGFIVRPNDDATMDFHWLPGMPMPGDPGWSWTDSYGFFGSAGFNNTTFEANLPLSGDGTEHEVYEVAVHGQADFWLGATGGSGFTPCSTDLIVNVCDPRNGSPSMPLLPMISGSAHVDVPEPSSIALFCTAAIAFRRRWFRQGRRTS